MKSMADVEAKESNHVNTPPSIQIPQAQAMKYLGFAGICVAVLTESLDATSIAVALPVSFYTREVTKRDDS
jgi:hypothetical protein